jgi:hypothetical protein
MKFSDQSCDGKKCYDADKAGDEHAVIIYFMYYKEELDELFELDKKLDKAITEQGVGRYDWHEINMDMSDGTLYMYGPNAENLFKAVKPILQQTDFTKRALAVLRFGGFEDGVKQIEVYVDQD